MACLSGTSSGSTTLPISEENLQQNGADMRKRKRLLSNRESARRSRMRKQKHVDDLMAQVTNLRAENNHILTNISVVSELTLNVEAENSIISAQISELSHRLQAINGLIGCMEAKGTGCASWIEGVGNHDDDFILNNYSSNLICVDQPITDPVEAFVI